MSTSEVIPRNIRRLRVAAGETQAAAAAGVGVHTVTWGRWENGTVRPTLDSLAAIAARYDVTLGDLVTEKAGAA